MRITLLTIFFVSYKLSQVAATERPIIGVVFHEVTSAHSNQISPNSTSYLAASYVKAIEASGARVAAIKLGQNESYYKDIVKHINGILIPGGDADFQKKKGYAEAVKILYDEAIKINKEKDYMPILGICLGFEVLIYLSNREKDIRADCNANRISLPLKFKPDFQDSSLFSDADPYLLQILSTEPVTSNHHDFCYTEKNFTKFGLDKEWKILSTNEDINGFEFISTVESLNYPFAAIQYHPEKNAYEWKIEQNNAHTPEAILSARHFFDWLVKEARKSNHSFPSSEEEFSALIANIKPIYTAPQNTSFEQVYFL